MPDLKNRFQHFFPEKYFLDFSIREINEYLTGQNWLLDAEYVQELEKPGEGNMNLVIRVKTNLRSFILKQARPWVEKYPQIAAPVERNQVEAEYFTRISKDPVLHSYTPELMGYDRQNFILVYKDLGNSADFTYVYNKGNHLKTEEIKELIGYLNSLHHLDCPTFPFNRSMRELNHEYIFEFPFIEKNGLDLNKIQSGLMETSLLYKKNKTLKRAIAELGKYYLNEGPVLIHGDYFPGSWLKSASGIKIIDPEFGFKGFAEFDLGVMIAHMMMAKQNKVLIDEIISGYCPPEGFDPRLLAGFSGIEILRRILGVAQLPLSLSLNEKKALMQIGSGWILSGKIDL